MSIRFHVAVWEEGGPVEQSRTGQQSCELLDPSLLPRAPPRLFPLSRLGSRFSSLSSWRGGGLFYLAFFPLWGRARPGRPTS